MPPRQSDVAGRAAPDLLGGRVDLGGAVVPIQKEAPFTPCSGARLNTHDPLKGTIGQHHGQSGTVNIRHQQRLTAEVDDLLENRAAETWHLRSAMGSSG